MKQLVLVVAMLSLIFSGVAFADEQKPDPAESTIVGPVMQNRYVPMTPEDEDAKKRSEATQKLLDQGVFTAVEDARANQQSQGIQK